MEHDWISPRGEKESITFIKVKASWCNYLTIKNVIQYCLLTSGEGDYEAANNHRFTNLVTKTVQHCLVFLSKDWKSLQQMLMYRARSEKSVLLNQQIYFKRYCTHSEASNIHLMSVEGIFAGTHMFSVRWHHTKVSTDCRSNVNN